jgi:hypothetical protein
MRVVTGLSVRVSDISSGGRTIRTGEVCGFAGLRSARCVLGGALMDPSVPDDSDSLATVRCELFGAPVASAMQEIASCGA